MPADRSLPSDVRAAIAAFLNECQNEARPFATTEALGAVRNIFPDLDISDSDLEDAISSEAAAAGFDIDYDSQQGRATVKRKALEHWDNEGGAIGAMPPRTEAQRRIDNDTAGPRRRHKATKDRNQLI
jgi:hypothetical protein